MGTIKYMAVKNKYYPLFFIICDGDASFCSILVSKKCYSNPSKRHRNL